MKKSILFFTLAFFLICSCTSKVKYLSTNSNLPLNETITDTKNEKERTNILGLANRGGFQQAPFKEWYDKYYDTYQPNPQAIAKGKKKLNGVEVLAFMGTWCGDSKRGVPRFYKVMDEMGFDEKNLKMVCLSDLSETYKQSPNGEERGLNIHRVPTFIFYKNGEEIGWIVESPVTSFEIDIAQIVNDLSPTPNYKVQQLIHQRLQEQGIAKMEEKLTPYAKYVSRNTQSSSELNSYGYVLMAQQKMEAALLVFKINAAAYPHVPNVFDSLAEAYLKMGNKNLAIENYKKVLELQPNDEHAKTELNKLGIKNIEG